MLIVSFLFFRGESPKEMQGNNFFLHIVCFLFEFKSLSMWSGAET